MLILCSPIKCLEGEQYFLPTQIDTLQVWRIVLLVIAHMKNSTNILEELLAGQVDWHPCKEKLVAINGKMTNKCNIMNTYQKHYMALCFPSWLIWEKTDHRNRIHVSDARNLIGGVDASAKCDEETLEKLMDIPDLIFGILLIIIYFF